MPTYREEVAERLAPLLAPMAGANPAGADISYDTDFETIKAEIDKLSSVDNSEPSWSKIEQLGTELLLQKGKDFRIVSWMAVAKCKNASWKGLAESLVLYNGLARSFWDTMYPEARRARARLNAIAWMADMINEHLAARDVVFADGDAIRTADEALKDLDQFLAEKLGDAYVGPGMLRPLLRDKVRAIPEPPPEPSSSTDEENQAPVEEAAAQVVEAPPAFDPESAERSVTTSAETIIAAAAILRGADPTRAWAYELQRRAIWLSVREPPAGDGTTTYTSGPDPSVMQTFADLRTGQNWPGLLTAAEELTTQNPFWLDLHRHVADAMERLGPTYNAARAAVGREVTHFVSRLPTLPDLKFSDATTPLADGATRTWLEEEARKYGGSSAASAAASAEDEEVARKLVEARKMLQDGKVADGLAIALALADRGPDARTRFKARLSVGKMALDVGKMALARAMLEHLVGDIERHGLETWEPALCATAYSYLLAATREVSRAKGGSPDLEAKEQHIFDKLCRLDPASAIKLST